MTFKQMRDELEKERERSSDAIGKKRATWCLHTLTECEKMVLDEIDVFKTKFIVREYFSDMSDKDFFKVLDLFDKFGKRITGEK